MNKKMKWAYVALRAQDMAQAVLEQLIKVILFTGIAFILAMPLGWVDPLLVLCVFATYAVFGLSVVIIGIIAFFSMLGLGYSEEEIERWAL